MTASTTRTRARRSSITFSARKLEDGAIEILYQKEGKVVMKQIRRLWLMASRSRSNANYFRRPASGLTGSWSWRNK